MFKKLNSKGSPYLSFSILKIEIQAMKTWIQVKNEVCCFFVTFGLGSLLFKKGVSGWRVNNEAYLTLKCSGDGVQIISISLVYP